MSAALRRHDTRDKHIEALQAENDRLRRDIEKLRECIRFLPPESFLAVYSLLFDVAYLSDGPRPEVRVGYQKVGGTQIPIKDFRAHKMKRRVDDQLYRLKYQIVQYLEKGEEIPEPDVQKWRKSQGK